MSPVPAMTVGALAPACGGPVTALRVTRAAETCSICADGRVFGAPEPCISRALARNYPAGNCYENSLAYQRLHGGQLVCGAMGYKSYDALKIRGKIAVRPDGACIDDKHKPVVMLDHGL